MSVLLALLLGTLLSPRPAEDTTPLRVATFNIRYASAKDGPDAWPLRRERVLETIRSLDADVVATQETEVLQAIELLEALPRYGVIGAHRNDGRVSGEGCMTFYDRRRFSVAESGVFWLSDTPDVPGSTSYGNTIPRVCTWARLIDLSDGRGLFVYNAHYDHRSQPSREQASRQILAHVATVARAPWPDDPVVLLGDFNATLENPAMAVFLEETFQEVVATHDPDGVVGTFTGFDPESDGGENTIDHILLSGPASVRHVGIDTRKIDGRYPSDHFPVWAELLWP